MQAIKVDRKELLNKLTENRDTHRALFLEAQAGYRHAVIDILEQRLAEARAGRSFNYHISLAVPSDQTRDYNRVIAMLEMSLGDAVELSEEDFAQYVQDDWSWKRQWLHSNRDYSQAVAQASAAYSNES